MHVHVLYFAVFRERIGATDEVLELADGATVADAVTALAARHAAVRDLRGRFRIAVNQAFVGDAYPLAERDELALIPPVAGGADAGDSRHLQIIDAPLSLDRCVDAVRARTAGAVVTFTGIVREQSAHGTVERLEYEAYAAMALRSIAELCDEVELEISGARIAVEHRIGTLVVGELAVVIAASAPHRAEAFAACRAMIDGLKQRAPIWKKEIAADGSEWIGLGP